MASFEVLFELFEVSLVNAVAKVNARLRFPLDSLLMHLSHPGHNDKMHLLPIFADNEAKLCSDIHFPASSRANEFDTSDTCSTQTRLLHSEIHVFDSCVRLHPPC